MTWRTPKRLAGLIGRLPHLPDGHLFIGLVVQMEGAASARMVAHNAVEDHHRAIFAALGRGHELFRIDAFAGQRGENS